LATGVWVGCFVIYLAWVPISSHGQDDAKKESADKTEAAATTEAPADDMTPKYPLNVAVQDGTLFVVDLDLPGVWQIKDGKRTLFVRGTKFLRKPMNRPRCIALHPDGGILVGDSATREVYHIASENAEPKPLCNAHVGIAMALAVSPDKQSIYIGDAEKRSVLRIPIAGGDPELIVRVNARGLAFDAEGKLWAVTPDAEAVYRIDTEEKKQEAIIKERPYQYPNGLVWAGDHGYVTDAYGKAVWKFTPDGKTEKWVSGDPLKSPVGIAIDDKQIYVAEPHKLQVYGFDRESKQVTERF
jgi:sugar lactone lactonase YvrE